MKLSPALPLMLVISLIVLWGLGTTVYFIKNHKNINKSILRRLSYILLILLMILGPEVPGGMSPPGYINLDVLFVVDTTASMGAIDYNGTQLRIDGARKDILSLVNHMVGARFALITFDSTSRLLLPYTSDTTAVTSAVNNMNREVYAYSLGTRVDMPLGLILKELQNSQKEHPSSGRLLFYLGDGEQTVPKPISSFAPAAKYIKGGGVFGYGTTKGAKMLKYSGFTGVNDFLDGNYITTYDPVSGTEVPGISKINEQELRQIASQLKVPYTNRNNGGSIQNVINTSRAPVIADTSRAVTSYVGLYWIFAMILGALFLWELMENKDRLDQLRHKEAQ